MTKADLLSESELDRLEALFKAAHEHLGDGPWFRGHPKTWISAPSKIGGAAHIADIRGWGYLIGGGQALNLDGDTAFAAQQLWGDLIVDAVNALPALLAQARLAVPPPGERREEDQGRCTSEPAAAEASCPAGVEPSAVWRPIESAPKDGGEVLTYREAGLMAVAAWYSYEPVWRPGTEESGWCVSDGADLVGVTHWRPLPDAPSPNETEPQATAERAELHHDNPPLPNHEEGLAGDDALVADLLGELVALDFNLNSMVCPNDEAHGVYPDPNIESDRVERITGLVTALLDRFDSLAGALEPFADIAEEIEDAEDVALWPDDDRVKVSWGGMEMATLDRDDFRRASDALRDWKGKR